MRLALAFLLVAGPGLAGVVPDPGGAGAWAAGGALLADPASPLVVFDAPVRLAKGIALQHARLFELDALTRTRVALGLEHGAWNAAIGYETFGPPELRRARAVFGIAYRGMLGAAWSERRGVAAEGRGGALDLAGHLDVRDVDVQVSARGVLSGGDPAVAADPDWTVEAAYTLGPARAHLARTRDFHGARTGGGIALAAGPLSVLAGAIGPPWSWTLGCLVGVSGARAGLARVVHPVLGASDVLEGGASW